MKHIFIILLFIIGSKTHAQVIELQPELSAFSSNGRLAIRVKSAQTLSVFFKPEANGSVGLNFYFADDDPHNGVHQALPTLQSDGNYVLAFPTLVSSTFSDNSLTFHVTEDFGNNIIKGYSFITGVYQGITANVINVCPEKISCSEGSGGLSMVFSTTGTNGILVGPEPLNFVLFSPGVSANGALTTNGYNIQLNSKAIRSILKPGDCSNILNGQTVLFINGQTCVFEDGQLTPNPECSPFGSYYEENTGCASFFENCVPSLTSVLDFWNDFAICQDWQQATGNNSCSINTSILHVGKVAIGTENFSSEASLSVKNGIITDKVKMCPSGSWCDYVFAPDYPLLPLPEVEKFIAEKRHLPGMPSAAEIESAGHFELGDITFRQQEKIEEIFLHLIEKDQEISTLETLVFLKELNQKTTTK